MQPKITKKKMLYIGLLCLDLLVIAGLVWYKYTHGMAQMQSDDASNLVYAKLLSEGNLLFSRDWYFPTEFNVGDGVPIYALLFRLFPSLSWLAVESLGNGVVLFLLALCALWLGHLLGLGAWSPALPLFVLVPTFSDYIYYSLMQGADFYLFGVLRVFLLLSLLCVATRTARRGPRAAALAGFAVVAFVMSLSGLRFLQVFALPLLLACLLLSVVCGRVFDAQNDGLPLKTLAAGQWQKQCGWQQLAVAVGAVLIGLVGYMINDTVLTKYFRFDTYESLTWQDFSLEGIEVTLGHYIWAFGYTDEGTIFSLAGVADLCALALLAFTLFACYKILRHWRDYTVWQRLMPVFWLSAAAVYLFINVFVYDKYRLRYLTHFFPVFGAVLLVFLLHDKTVSRLGRRLLAVGLTVCMLVVSVNAFDHYKDDIHNEEIPIQYLQQATDEALALGYDFGYGSFWDANVVTYLSNGQIAMCSLHTFDWWYPYEWLNRRDYVQNGSEGPVFLLLSTREYNELAEKEYDYLNEEYLLSATDQYRMYGYENTAALQSLFEPMPE